MLIGNVGTEPDVHYFEADQAVAKLRLATTERGYTLPNGTQVPDRTDWHNLLFDRRLAKIVEKYVHKGDKLYVEGRLRNRSYDDKRGIRHQYTEIEVENMEFLTPRSSVSSTSLRSHLNKLKLISSLKMIWTMLISYHFNNIYNIGPV